MSLSLFLSVSDIYMFNLQTYIFAVLQLISAAGNELGLIRDQSAQTATQAVGIAYCYWLSLYTCRVLNNIEMWEHIYIAYIYYIYTPMMSTTKVTALE